MEVLVNLDAIGRPALPSIISFMANPDSEIREMAVLTAAHLGPDRALSAQVKQLLQDPDQKVREAATNAIELIGLEEGIFLLPQNPFPR